MKPGDYSKLRRRHRELKLPYWGRLTKAAQNLIRKTGEERLISTRVYSVISEVPNRMFKERLTRSEFASFLVDQTPKFDELILQDISATDGWLSKV